MDVVPPRRALATPTRPSGAPRSSTAPAGRTTRRPRRTTSTSRPSNPAADFEQVDPETSTPALLAFVATTTTRPDAEGLEILDDDAPTLGRPALDRAAGARRSDPRARPGPLPFDEEELEAEFDGEDEYDPLEEDEDVAEFTLARGSAETVEELDLAAMVDVAFQLVLFFLVTATTVFYKSLEVPKPTPEAPPEAAAAGQVEHARGQDEGLHPRRDRRGRRAEDRPPARRGA